MKSCKPEEWKKMFKEGKMDECMAKFRAYAGCCSGKRELLREFMKGCACHGKQGSGNTGKEEAAKA